MKRSTIDSIFAENLRSSHHSSDSSVTESLEEFRAVLEAADFEKLNEHVVNLRKAGDSNDVTCEISFKVALGASNIVFPLEFSDGKKWLIRIPQTGTPEAFDDAAARNMIAEVRTMQLIKRETDVPIPTVFDFDATCNNPFNVPYIIMEWIEGKQLSYYWADFSIGREERMKRNCQTLRELAAMVMKLNKFDFSGGGSPLFDEDGHLLQDVGPFLEEDYTNGAGRYLFDEGSESSARAYKSLGPYSTWEAFFFDDFDSSSKPDYIASNVEVARLFESWIPPCQPDVLPFVLAHPDLDTQNIIVDEHGHVLSLLDWDHIRTVPRCLGNESYPKWLTGDMDHFHPKEHVQEGCKTSDGRELSAREMEQQQKKGFEGDLGWWVATDSPEDLEAYRAVWDQAIYDLAGAKARAVARGSLLLTNIYMALDEPVFFLARFAEIQQRIQERMVNEGLISTDRIWESPEDDASVDPDDDTDIASVSGADSSVAPDHEEEPVLLASTSEWQIPDGSLWATAGSLEDQDDRQLQPQSGSARRVWEKMSSSFAKLVCSVTEASRHILGMILRFAQRTVPGDDHYLPIHCPDTNPSARSLESPAAGTIHEDGSSHEDEHQPEWTSDGTTIVNAGSDDEPYEEDLEYFDPEIYGTAIRDGTLSNADMQLLKRGFELFVS